MTDEQVSGPNPGETPESDLEKAGHLTRRQAVSAGAAAVAGLSIGQLVSPALGLAATPGSASYTLPLEERIELAVAKLSTDPAMINKLLPKSTAKPALLKSLQLSDVTKRYEPQVVQQLMTMMKDAATAPGGAASRGGETPASGERVVEWVGALATLAAGALAA